MRSSVDEEEHHELCTSIRMVRPCCKQTHRREIRQIGSLQLAILSIPLLRAAFSFS
jgi:hypothetical protein